MGIETALIGMGLSAATASAVSTGLITAGIGAVASTALAPKPAQAATPAPITAAEKPPQASQAPDAAQLLKKNALAAGAMGPLAGNNSTLLTGSAGVNPASLSLGQSSLLGQ